LNSGFSVLSAILTVHVPDRSRTPILYEDLCFDCQQAVEKSLKALLVAKDLKSPHTHIIAVLLETLEQDGTKIPAQIKSAVDLTEYAVHTRYPGLYEPVTADDYREALATTERVHEWVNAQLKKRSV
jgi:HEPN domain-containing protein